VHTYLILEPVLGGTLADTIESRANSSEPGFAEEQIKEIVKQMIYPCIVLVEKGFYGHNDLKVENILLRKKGETDIVLCDFGTAVLRNTSRRTMAIGTPATMAKETWKGRSLKADSYAIGCITYELLTGKLLDGPIQPQHLASKELTRASSQLQRFVKDSTRTEPSERFSLHELLEHPFIR